MKIAYIFDSVYPYHLGGAEKRYYEIARRMAARGHDVHIYGMKQWEGEDNFTKEKVHYHGVCQQRELYDNSRRSISEAIYFALHLLPHLITEKFDIVDMSETPYMHCFVVKLCSMIHKYPVVITWHEVWSMDYWMKYIGKAKGAVGFLLSKMATRTGNAILSISPKVTSELPSLAKTKIYNVGRGVEIPQHGTGESSHIIYAGRLEPNKNVRMLIEAISIVSEAVPDVSCIIIGEGQEKPYLISLSNSLGLSSHIKFREHISEEAEFFAHFRNSQIFVFPSIREGFGSVIIEAWACGLPVIAVNHPENNSAQLIEHGKNGMLVEPNPESIAQAIINLLKDKNQRSKMSRYALSCSKRYNWEEQITNIERIYKQVISCT